MLMDLGAERGGSPLDNLPMLPALPEERMFSTQGLAFLAIAAVAAGLWWLARRIQANPSRARYHGRQAAEVLLFLAAMLGLLSAVTVATADGWRDVQYARICGFTAVAFAGAGWLLRRV